MKVPPCVNDFSPILRMDGKRSFSFDDGQGGIAWNPSKWGRGRFVESNLATLAGRNY